MFVMPNLLTLVMKPDFTNPLTHQNPGITKATQPFFKISDLSIINSKTNSENTPGVKVYNELIANIIKVRKLRNAYQTNRIFKPIATFFLLKSVTPSSVIQQYTQQLSELLQYLRIGKTTFYSHVRELESLGLCKRVGGALRLCSYDKMCELFELTEVSNVTRITYDHTKHRFYELMYASLLHNKQVECDTQVRAKIDRIPEFKEVLQELGPDVRRALLDKQISDFKNGTQSFEYEIINADVQITARSIHKQFGFKSYKSVAYLKARLKAASIATVEKREYVSEHRSRKRHQYVAYLTASKSTLWRLPDEIRFPGGLFSC